MGLLWGCSIRRILLRFQRQESRINPDIPCISLTETEPKQLG